MSTLSAEGLCYRRAGVLLLDHCSLSLSPGELVVLLGPNGAGKTTLLRAVLGLIRPDAGQVQFDGQPIRSMSALQRARRCAYLPQSRPLAWPKQVRDVVALGRFAYGAGSGRLSATDQAAVDRAIGVCGLTSLAARSTVNLSGGELARVHLARALATEAPLLIADEPVAALDPRHQHEVLNLFVSAVRRGTGILAVLHDLDLAARYADRLIWINRGRIVADGSPVDTMTPERLAEVYGIDARIERRDGVLGVTVTGAR